LCTWRDVHGERYGDGDPQVEPTTDGLTFEGCLRIRGPAHVPGYGWYRGVRYRAEAERGLNDRDDLWFPLFPSFPRTAVLVAANLGGYPHEAHGRRDGTAPTPSSSQIRANGPLEGAVGSWGREREPSQLLSRAVVKSCGLKSGFSALPVGEDC